MTATPVGHIIRSLKLAIGTQSVECSVLGAAFVRGGRAKQTSQTGCGIVTDYGPAEDSLDVDYNVDKTAGSFHRYLIEHEGEDVVAELVDGHSGVTESATVRITAGNQTGKTIGGWATGTVSLGVSGAITITDPVAAAAE